MFPMPKWSCCQKEFAAFVVSEKERLKKLEEDFGTPYFDVLRHKMATLSLFKPLAPAETETETDNWRQTQSDSAHRVTFLVWFDQ